MTRTDWGVVGRTITFWVTFYAALLLFMVGCAVTAPATPPQPGDWQGMADQAVAALGKYRGRVFITTHASDSLGHYYCNGSRITLGTAGNTKWLLAHELGHHLNGHCDESLPHEIEANSSAIKVLQVWGQDEEGAVYSTEAHLRGLQQLRGSNPLQGHSYCAELDAVIKEYPQYPFNKQGLC